MCVPTGLVIDLSFCNLIRLKTWKSGIFSHLGTIKYPLFAMIAEEPSIANSVVFVDSQTKLNSTPGQWTT